LPSQQARINASEPLCDPAVRQLKVYQLFGDELNSLIEHLNESLAA